MSDDAGLVPAPADDERLRMVRATLWEFANGVIWGSGHWSRDDLALLLTEYDRLTALRADAGLREALEDAEATLEGCSDGADPLPIATTLREGAARARAALARSAAADGPTAQTDGVRAMPVICGVVSEGGPSGEPLACAWTPHGTERSHSWSSLPTHYEAEAENHHRRVLRDGAAALAGEPVPTCTTCGDVPGYCPECGGGQTPGVIPPAPPWEPVPGSDQ
jgi:hypothetical protein